MKRLLSVFTLLLALVGPAFAAPPRPAVALTHVPTRPTETVYVCLSSTSYAYHRSDACAGLNRCSHPLKAMSTAEAQRLGKRACKRCYRNAFIFNVKS